MMARSDDGGETWAAIWDVERQPWLRVPRIASGLGTDFESGDIYWGWQDTLDETGEGLVLLRSTDDGATWNRSRLLLSRKDMLIPDPGHIGYADTIVVNDKVVVAYMSTRNGQDPPDIEVILTEKV